jgi:hypothetical protein
MTDYPAYITDTEMRRLRLQLRWLGRAVAFVAGGLVVVLLAMLAPHPGIGPMVALPLSCIVVEAGAARQNLLRVGTPTRIVGQCRVGAP